MFDNPAYVAYFKTACMVVAILGSVYIVYVSNKRRSADSRWLLPMIGALLMAVGYVEIILMWGPTEDQFMALSQSFQPSGKVFVWFLKAGLLLVVIGAFGLSKPRNA